MHAGRDQPPGAGPVHVGMRSRNHGPWDSALLPLGTGRGGTPTWRATPKVAWCRRPSRCTQKGPACFPPLRLQNEQGSGMSRELRRALVPRGRGLPTQPQPSLAGRPAERGCGGEPSPRRVERMSLAPGSGHGKRPETWLLHDGAACHAAVGNRCILSPVPLSSLGLFPIPSYTAVLCSGLLGRYWL